MITTWKQLSRPLRAAIAAPSGALVALVTLAFAGGSELRLDGAHKPLSEVNLSSSLWTGTLDAARLPANIPAASFGPFANSSADYRAYDGGPGVRYGWGIRPFESQSYLPDGAHFSWTGGGDLQATGTGEVMRLYAGGGLHIGGTSDPGFRGLAVEGNATFVNDLHVGGNITGSATNLTGYADGLAVGGADHAENASLADSADRLSGTCGVASNESGDLSVAGTLRGGGIIAAAIYADNGDPSIDLVYAPTTGALRCDGTIALEWTYGEINVPGTARFGGGIATIHDDGAASFGNGLEVAGQMYSDEICFGDAIHASDGATVIDGEHNGYFGNAHIGELHLSTQEALPGTITPDRTLTVFDAMGTAYLVPCAAK